MTDTEIKDFGEFVNKTVRDSTYAFENALKKKAFTTEQCKGEDYIMYMESDAKYDYFKSKLTKTRWTVER